MYPSVHILGFAFPTYHLLVAFGVFFSLLTLFSACRRKRLPLDFIADHFFIFFIAGAVSGRILYGLTTGLGVVDTLFFWQDFGFDFFGAMVGFFASCAYLARRMNQELAKWFDAGSLTLAPLLIFHHVGTFLTGANYGKVTIMPWGVTFTHPESVFFNSIPVHPVQLYSALLWVALFGVLIVLYRKESQAGYATAYGLLFGGIGTFFLEFLRGDSAVTFMSLRLAQWESLLLVLLGGLALAALIAKKRKKLRGEVTLPQDSTHTSLL